MPKKHPDATPANTTSTTGDQPETMLDWALHWAGLGWPVFPLAPRTKLPLFKSPHPKGQKCQGQCGQVGHGVHDATRDPDKIRAWWESSPNAGIGGSTLDRLVVDVDYNHDGERKAVLPQTREHLSGRGNGNVHLIYRTDKSASARAMPAGKLMPGVDVKTGRGSYVVLPPSIHPDTKKPYTVGAEHDEYALTDEDVESIWNTYGAKTPAAVKGAAKGMHSIPGGKTEKQGGGGGGGGGGGMGVTAKLSELLTNPPTRGQGTTNEWLTAVAGHYAKMHRDKRDLYEVEVRRAAALVDPDYEDTEKVLESVWATEVSGHPERDATEDNGYLVGTGLAILCQAYVGAGNEREFDLLPWGNFDLIARGVMVSEDDHRAYQVTLNARGKSIETTLSPVVLADPKKLAVWLARYGVGIATPATAYPQIERTVRLQRYLEAQNPPEVRLVDHLGWDHESGKYVTFDGAITKDGPVGVREAGIVIDNDKVTRRGAKLHHGFEGTWERAQEVLREVQTFQAEDTVHPFGAWWAACLLKPQAMAVTSLFPFFGVEGVSGSGKTTGYFELMVQLNGNYRGTVLPTTASFRDMTIASSSGIVWADDLNDPSRLEEILRASTAGGTVVKMDEDRKPRDFEVIAPLLFSGEALGFSSQKALMDRGVVINPLPPNDRKSQKPGREHLPQYDDVVALREQFDGERKLATLAGWYVQEALAVQDKFTAAIQESRTVTGRRGDKYAVFRAGARLLDHLMGHRGAWKGKGETAVWVDAWVDERTRNERGREDDSVLTTKLIPWAIRTFGPVTVGNPHTVDFRGSKNQAPPVLVEVDGEGTMAEQVEVWVNVPLLAQAWEESRGGRIDERLESPDGLSRQVQQVSPPVKDGGRRGKKVGGRVVQYRILSATYSQLSWDRAQESD